MPWPRRAACSPDEALTPGGVIGQEGACARGPPRGWPAPHPEPLRRGGVAGWSSQGKLLPPSPFPPTPSPAPSPTHQKEGRSPAGAAWAPAGACRGISGPGTDPSPFFSHLSVLCPRCLPQVFGHSAGSPGDHTPHAWCGLGAPTQGTAPCGIQSPCPDHEPPALDADNYGHLELG